MIDDGRTLKERREEQKQLEQRMINLGIERYRSQTEKAAKRGELADTEPGRAFTRSVVEPLAERIKTLQDKSKSRGVGRRSRAMQPIMEMDPGILAYLTARATFNALIGHEKHTYVAQQVGMLVQDQQMCEQLAQADPLREKNTTQSLRKRGVRTRNNRKHNYGKAAKKAVPAWKPWPQTLKITVGTILLEELVALGLFKIVTMPSRGKSEKRISYLYATDELVEWVRQRRMRGELLRPLRLPMICQPKERTGGLLIGSGYYSEAIPTRAVIKFSTRQQRDSLRKSDKTVLKTALRILDRVPRAINVPVLRALEALWENNIPAADLPVREPLALPQRPARDADEETVRAYRQEARNIHEANHRLLSKKLMVERIIDTANEYKDYPEIFFPHEIDWRGRVYAIPATLNPQGPDYARGLLRFAEGKAIRTESARRWLMIHGANCWGYDKVGLDDRVQWSEERLKRVLATAQDPLADYWWTEADKPFMFLAWCFDVAGVMRGEDSFIPIAMDGSCNGLQHLSAMLLDPVGGAAVNLVPHDKPADIYQEVADRVTAKLREMEGDWIAETLLQIGIDRKLTKRPVMVMPYGGKYSSTMDYVEIALREKLGNDNPFGEDFSKANNLLSKLIYNSVRDTVVKAAEAMNWMQRAAGVMAKANLPVKWTTPAGLECCQTYWEDTDHLIRTYLDGSIVRSSTIKKHGDRLNLSKMKNSISPNFVHSLDAAALMLTVIACKERGVEDFEMIHDSYGTHAADTEVLAEVLREQFVAIYQNGDVLKRFREEIISQLPEDLHSEIPEVPQCGSLDIEEVRHSDFFFA